MANCIPLELTLTEVAEVAALAEAKGCDVDEMLRVWHEERLAQEFPPVERAGQTAKAWLTTLTEQQGE